MQTNLTKPNQQENPDFKIQEMLLESALAENRERPPFIFKEDLTRLKDSDSRRDDYTGFRKNF